MKPTPSNSAFNIEPIPRDPAHLQTFYQVPFSIYPDTSPWVAPFRTELFEFFSDKNMFWQHADCCLFLVRRDDVVVGRIAAIIDDLYAKLVGSRIGFFGFFECIEDYACAEALLNAAQKWLQSKGAAMMRGPIDGRVDVGCGFLIQGFDAPQSLLATYTPPYYARFAEQYGLSKVKDLLTYRLDLTVPLSKRLTEKAKESRDAGIRLRKFRRLRTGSELRWWIPMFLDTFKDHWGFVPVSEKEVRQRFGIKQMRWFVDSKLFLIAEFNGVPVAYLWSTPDYNEVFHKMHGRLGLREVLMFLRYKNQIKTGKLHLIGISKDFRDKAIASYLNEASFLEMQRRGYRYAEVGWIDEANTAAHNTMAVAGTTISKIHRVYEKSLRGETVA